MIQYHLGMISAQLGDKDATRQALSAAATAPTPFPGQDEAKKALPAPKYRARNDPRLRMSPRRASRGGPAGCGGAGCEA